MVEVKEMGRIFPGFIFAVLIALESKFIEGLLPLPLLVVIAAIAVEWCMGIV